MRKGESIKAFFANKNILYSFEVWPNYDKESFIEALDDETLDNFKLVSITKKDGYQPIFETNDLAEVVVAIDDIMKSLRQKLI